jgi:hypothetical protein
MKHNKYYALDKTEKFCVQLFTFSKTIDISPEKIFYCSWME